MKKLYLLRHADAVPMGPGQKDAHRSLTELGKRQASEAAAEAKLRKFSFDLILASPYARARETARIWGRFFEMPEKVIEEPLLACGCSVEEIRKILFKHQGCGGILCVGHEPDLGVIAAGLLGQDHSSPFQKAECREIHLPNVIG